MKGSGNIFKRIWKKILEEQLLIPLTALLLLVLFNLIRDPGFFVIETRQTPNGIIFGGNLVSAIYGASELAIISMGMTLVTSACGGQDISVGAVGAISASIFVKTLLGIKGQMGMADVTGWTVAVAVLACIAVSVLFMLFNGTLVAIFRIQPMIATLILYSCGRAIAYAIIGSADPQIGGSIVEAIGLTIPGFPIHTAILVVIAVGLILMLFFRLTNTRLYTETVGVNQGAARLNGINPVLIKLLAFVILGFCVAIAGVVGVCKNGKVGYLDFMDAIEMDAILAVAIGGNNLGGGKFRMSGSILGAYIISLLTTTLLAMQVASANIRAYKAIVIIIIVAAGSPAIKNWITDLKNRALARRANASAGEVQ